MPDDRPQEDLLELSLEDAEFILGMDVKEYTGLRPGKCAVCSGTNPFSMDPAKAILDGQDDLIVEGKCEGCANPLEWRLATSKSKDMRNRAQHVRSIRGLFSV